MGGRRVSFWLAVGGVSLLANFGAELVAERWPQLGLARFVAYTHKGVS
jgi:hypothetical protein